MLKKYHNIIIFVIATAFSLPVCAMNHEEALNLLGLAGKPTTEEINNAYKKQALKWHPDRASYNKLTLEQATKKFQDLGNAKDFLLKEPIKIEVKKDSPKKSYNQSVNDALKSLSKSFGSDDSWQKAIQEISNFMKTTSFDKLLAHENKSVWGTTEGPKEFGRILARLTPIFLIMQQKTPTTSWKEFFDFLKSVTQYSSSSKIGQRELFEAFRQYSSRTLQIRPGVTVQQSLSFYNQLLNHEDLMQILDVQDDSVPDLFGIFTPKQRAIFNDIYFLIKEIIDQQSFHRPEVTPIAHDLIQKARQEKYDVILPEDYNKILQHYNTVIMPRSLNHLATALASID